MYKNQRSISSAVRVAAGTSPAAGQPEAGPNTAVIEKPFLRAAIETAAIVEENGHVIVPVVFATETPVRRYNYRYNDYEGEYFDEVLSMDAAHIRLDRLNNGGPVLDSHDRFGAVSRVVLGIVVEGSARIENGRAVARLRLSNRADLADFRADVRAGIIRNISVGYDVTVFTREEAVNTNAVPVYRATEWEPSEISFVPVPADINSGVRGAAGSTPPENSIIIPMKFGQRSQPQRNAQATPGENGGAAPTPAPAPAPAAPAPAAPAPATPTPVSPAAPAPAGRSLATEERARVLGIQTLVRTLNLPEAFGEELVNGEVSLDTARERALARFAENDPTRQISGANSAASASVRNNSQTAESFGRAAVAAILVRAGRGAILTDAERTAARDVQGMSLLRLAEQSIVVAGGSVGGMSQRQIAQAAIGLGRSAAGMHTTTDFPILLTSAVSRTLLAEYAETPNTFDPFVARGTLNDFRTTNRVRMTELLKDFAKVQEAGEYTYNTFGETGEGVTLGKYGSILGISWESIINDDLGAFNRLPRAMARKSRKLQGDLVYGILTGNPKLADGKNLFSSEHKNLATAGSNISIASMSAARSAMKKQVAPGQKDASQYLNIAPRYLIVGPELETEAEQFVNGVYAPQKQAEVNIFQGKLTIIVDGHLTDRSWYLAAAPGEIDTIELNFLAGEPELFTEERYGFDRDSYELKARTVVGAAPIDFRGLYKNSGGNAPA